MVGVIAERVPKPKCTMRHATVTDDGGERLKIGALAGWSFTDDSPFRNHTTVNGYKRTKHGAFTLSHKPHDFANAAHGNPLWFARAIFHGVALSLSGAAALQLERGGGTAGATAERARDFGGKATRERSSHASKSWRR